MAASPIKKGDSTTSPSLVCSKYPPFGAFTNIPRRRSARTQKEYAHIRGISVESLYDAPPPDPIVELSDIRLSKFPEVLKATVFRPAPLQAQVWPIACLGLDLIGIEETGSQKTLAYLWPITASILHINGHSPSPRDGPVVLILAPECEDVNKIQQECAEFGPASNIKTSTFHEWSPEKYDLEKGVQVLIATPGSMIRMLSFRPETLQRVICLVVDDCDRMVDVGCNYQVEDIVTKMNPDCQKLFFSAKWSEECDNMARHLHSPYKVVIGSPHMLLGWFKTQEVHLITEEEKSNKLLQIKRSSRSGKALVFVLEQNIDEISSKLKHMGLRIASVREAGLHLLCEEFLRGCSSVLIVTHDYHDEIIRQLDKLRFDSVGHDVINYDFPGSLDDYVTWYRKISIYGERACTFFTAANAGFAKGFISLLRESGNSISRELEALGSDAPYKEKVSIANIINPDATSSDKHAKQVDVGDRCKLQKKEQIKFEHYTEIKDEGYPEIKKRAKFRKSFTELYKVERCCGDRCLRLTCVHYPGIQIGACIAVEEVNKKMVNQNRELHLVRVLEAYKQSSCGAISRLHLMFEVVDAGVVKACRAIIMKDYKKGRDPPPETKSFVLVNHDGSLSTLVGIEKGKRTSTRMEKEPWRWSR